MLRALSRTCKTFFVLIWPYLHRNVYVVVDSSYTLSSRLLELCEQSQICRSSGVAPSTLPCNEDIPTAFLAQPILERMKRTKYGFFWFEYEHILTPHAYISRVLYLCCQIIYRGNYQPINYESATKSVHQLMSCFPHMECLVLGHLFDQAAFESSKTIQSPELMQVFQKHQYIERIQIISLVVRTSDSEEVIDYINSSGQEIQIQIEGMAFQHWNSPMVSTTVLHNFARRVPFTLTNLTVSGNPEDHNAICDLLQRPFQTSDPRKEFKKLTIQYYCADRSIEPPVAYKFPLRQIHKAHTQLKSAHINNYGYKGISFTMDMYEDIRFTQLDCSFNQERNCWVASQLGVTADCVVSPVGPHLSPSKFLQELDSLAIHGRDWLDIVTHAVKTRTIYVSVNEFLY